MKAAILMESYKPLVVDNIELPDELSAGRVLVKIHYSGICGAQINEVEAVKGQDVEGCGKIYKREIYG